MSSLPKYVKISLEIFIPFVIGGVVINLFSDVVKDWLKDIPWARDHNTLLISILVVLVVITIILINTSSNTKEKSNTSDAREELITGLQRRYEKRLFRKMDNELKFEIQLELAYTKLGTAQEYIETYFLEDYDEKSVGNFGELFKTYLKKLKRLLIIGEPGSGKTVLLLKFAQHLLEMADRLPDFPVAIILNLSSWRDEGQTFLTWLEQSLVFAAGEYGASKQQAKELIQSNELLLLLDGLDEIPEDHRDSCLQRLNIYLQEVNAQRPSDKAFPEVIICCRREEYVLMQENAPVQASVLIQPLTLNTVQIALERIQKGQVRGLPADRLQRAIQEKKPITALLVTAFFVHLALSLTKRRINFEEIDNTEIFLKLYIQEEIRTIKLYAKPESIYHWLSWLATKLIISRKGIIFELTDIQPNWLQITRQFRLTLGLISCLLCILISIKVSLGIFVGFLVLLILTSSYTWFLIFFVFYTAITFSELRYVLIGGLSFGLGFGQFVKNPWSLRREMFIAPTIQPAEVLTFKRISRQTLPKSLIIGLSVGLFGGFTEWIGSNLSSGISFGLCSTLVVILFDLLFTSKRFPKINMPYQRLMGPIVIEYIFWGFLATIQFIAMPSQPWLQRGFYQIVIFLCYTLVFTSLGKHIVLRFLLWCEGTIPFQLVGFLDLVTEKTSLMEKDGGHWRFRHQLIQDMLAGKTITPTPEAGKHD